MKKNTITPLTPPEPPVKYPQQRDGGQNVEKTPDKQPPMAAAMVWVSRITTIALLMVLPGLGGLWLDRKLGTKVVFTLAGFVLGLTAGIWQLVKLSGGRPTRSERTPD